MKPIIIKNSWVPVFLSKFSPIDIWAITIWPFVFCRYDLDRITENHESIHIEQYNDLFVFGFLLVYCWDYLHGIIKYRSDLSRDAKTHYTSVRDKAYYRTRAEQEAYEFEYDLGYRETRKRYAWLTKYKV